MKYVKYDKPKISFSLAVSDWNAEPVKTPIFILNPVKDVHYLPSRVRKITILLEKAEKYVIMYWVPFCREIAIDILYKNVNKMSVMSWGLTCYFRN